MTPPATAAAALPRTRTVPGRAPVRHPARAPVRHPRRISGPARPRPAAAPARRSRSISLDVLLDRLVRGRVWIGALAVALIGLVAMQLLVLKLNSQIGRELQRQVALQRGIAETGIQSSESSAGARVQALAAASGMTLAAPDSLRFLTASTAYVRQALAALAKPVQPAEAQATPAQATPAQTTPAQTTQTTPAQTTPGG